MGNEKSKTSSSARVREIISVLRKHKVREDMTPQKLRGILEDLGPTFIKLGQIISMHPDILPQEYCDELSKLCSDVAPMEFAEVISIIEESCGCSWNKVFSWICETPEGSASIAQVHRARLCTGEQVVVKVERRGIYDVMACDIQLMHRLIRFLPADLKNMADLDEMLDDIWTVTREEMNFVTEAANLKEFARRNRDIAFIGAPKLYDRYTSMNMFVMEYVDGCAIDDKNVLVENGYDLKEIAQKLADNYMKQIIGDGFFHADPHVGNIRVRDGKIIWIDMGMMGRLTENDRQQLILGVEGIALNDYAMIEDAVLTLCDVGPDMDRVKLKTEIESLLKKYGRMGMGNINLTEFITELMEIMRENQIKMPHNLTLLLRSLTHMQGLLADLSPDINMMEIARTQIMQNLRSPSYIQKELEDSGKKLLLSLRKFPDIPSDLSDSLKTFQSGEARMKMELTPSHSLLSLLYGLVNTLVEGLIIMALLIASSIVCTTDLQPKILGMPVVAFIGFLLAFVLAVHMIVRSVRKK